ncbi:MAG: WD40 repeat domain-containing protein, partial [Cyanobacteria bacterium J06632_3]
YRLGYAGGNFVNLMVELSQGELSQKDFSQLTIWQAYLQGAKLRDVNFNRCELNRSVFTETLSDVLTVALTMTSPTSAQIPEQSPAYVACGDTNGVVHLWQQNDGQKCAEWAAHDGWVRAIALVPGQPLLATGGDDKKLKLWQLPAPHQGPVIQAKQLWQTSEPDKILTIALSPDGRLIACGGERYISLHHTHSGEEICRFPHYSNHETNRESPESILPETIPEQQSPSSSRRNRQTRVRSLALSSDGQWLASGGDDQTIRLWAVNDLSQQNSLAQSQSLNQPAPDVVLNGHQKWVRSLQFIPNTHQLVSGSDDETVRIWDIETQTCINVLPQPSDRIRTIAISPDGELLASGGDDCQILLWNLKTHQLLQTIPTRQSRIWSTGFQQWGNKLLLAAGGDKQTLMLWQIHTHRQQDASLEKEKEKHTRKRRKLSVRDASVYEMSEAEQETDTLEGNAHSESTGAQLPPLDAKARLIKTYRGYTNGIRAVSFLGNRRILSGGDSRDLCVWDSQTGEQTASLSMHQGRIWALDVDLQNGRIASASDDHTIRLWDVNTGQCLTTLGNHTSWVRTVAFSYRGRFLASSGDDCTIRIWNTATGFCLKVLNTGSQWIRTVSFDPTNSRYLVSGGDDQIIRCWDRKEGISTHTFAMHDHRICSVAYSSDGKYIASGSDDNTVILWDVAKQEMCDRFKPTELGIKAVAFSPDGKYLAAGSEDQMVYVWDLTAPKETRFRLRPQDYTGSVGGIRSVAFSPDSAFIISGGLDEMIRIGDLRKLQEGDTHFLQPLVQPARPYENIKIEAVKGLNRLQKANLLTLGAVDRTASLLM